VKSSDLKAYLAKTVKKGEPDPFWLVTGTDEFLAVEAGDAIRAAVHGLGYTDRQVLDMSGQSDWSRLAMAAADIGMFDDKKLIEVRLPGGKPGTKGAKAIPEYLERPVAGTVTMFTVPAPDWSAAKAAWWTALQKKCTVVDCSAVERREMPAWLRGRLAEKGLTASDETLEFFADLTEGNLLPRRRKSRSSRCSARPAKSPPSRSGRASPTTRASTSGRFSSASKTARPSA
jgi:DNA polymerase III subunit delta